MASLGGSTPLAGSGALDAVGGGITLEPAECGFQISTLTPNRFFAVAGVPVVNDD